jgi:hypothetical protein
MVLPSNLLVYGATLGAIQRREPAVFLTLPEAAALEWLMVTQRRAIAWRPRPR